MKAVDGLQLPEPWRSRLCPGAARTDDAGRSHRLPRFFYEIPTLADAGEIWLTPHFSLAELIATDLQEPLRLLAPVYVPCAVSVLARYLEEFRLRVGASVHVSVNGGYRSPVHRRSAGSATPHQWATAADIYRIGETWLDTPRSIERFGKIAASLGPEVHVKPFGHGPGRTDDHLHLDLGFVTVVPHGFCEL